MGQKEAVQIANKLRTKTRSELIDIVKDEYFNKVEKHYPGYHPKSTIIEILSAELQGKAQWKSQKRNS